MRKAPQHAAGISALTVGKPDPKVLQDFLALKFALSRRTAKAMIDGRSVWVNRKCVWIARFALRTGALVEIPSQVVKGAKRQNEEIRVKSEECRGRSSNSSFFIFHSSLCHRHIRVIWSNDNYLICDKPAGLVSCDDPKSVETILREQEKVPTLEAVHRLDRDTTGCLLFAKNHAALVAAVDVFKTHKVSKVYHAISAGSFKFAHQIVDTPLDGQPAVSKVTREQASADASFLRIRIETGRTNQIRRHLASIRCPIIGDRVFGLKNVRDPRLMQVPRQMLHASTLTLPDPLDPHAEIKAHSPLPADFRSALRLFGMGKR
ncbi:MAG: RluA family pseudouridine synthase [bacterium]|nr:RluA family pseudouridine synthase [Candidatus Colisoma equi]